MVVEEMKNVISFWLDLGVDGFRMDAVAHIWEDGEFKDEPVSYDSDVSQDAVNPQNPGENPTFLVPEPITRFGLHG